MPLRSVTVYHRLRSNRSAWGLIAFLLCLSLLFSAALRKAISPLGDSVIRALGKQDEVPAFAGKNPQVLPHSGMLKNNTHRASY